MSTHPNVILMAVLTPDDLPMKTMREIVGKTPFDEGTWDIKIGGKDYYGIVQQTDYEHDGWQIAAPVGSLVFFRMVTYGYGEVITWDDLQIEKFELEKWAKEVCEKHHCTWDILVTANYW